ncbi:unnamed protein product [Haemonchus placei]|uniref:Uncharacterized protein n=1 Tax=Haemonchus placei TaxID=6290 RepID=A0A0N4W7K8_HAEPC|nr:unnamed protein product [Haemonchus placei]
MTTFHKILSTALLIGLAAFFYEVQGAPTETAVRLLDNASSENSTAVTTDGAGRVKRQGGGGCGCGCCGCGGGGGCAAVDVPVAALVVVLDAAHVAGLAADAVRYMCHVRGVVKPASILPGCGCCGCGGGGRKRRSLDNLRIRLDAKKSAELKGEQLLVDDYPRQKRDSMCYNDCASPSGSHCDLDVYGDY